MTAGRRRSSVSFEATPSSPPHDVVSNEHNGKPKTDPYRNRKRPRQTEDHPRLARLVSQDFDGVASLTYISGDEEDEETNGICPSSELELKRKDTHDDGNKMSPTPVPIRKRCVSVLENGSSRDDVAAFPPVYCAEISKSLLTNTEPAIPPLPNPLHDNSRLLSAHIRSLRLEAELFPMRQIVSRLMAHPAHNRRGIFNIPVDPVALRLPDYHTVITKPMDLGTIKTRLHSVTYNHREEVADDIRLVFQNAMKYNPPSNIVHIAARNLLQFFEESYQVLQATSNTSGSSSPMAKPVPSVGPPPPLQLHPTTAETDRIFEQPVSSNAIPVVLSPTTPHKTNLRSSLMVVDPSFGEGQGGREKALKRAMSVAAKHAKHSCRSCLGRACSVCLQGCLPHEPTLLICSGSNCCGARIRKGASYYIAKDGSRQFCQRCYTSLHAVLPNTNDQKEASGTAVRYKRDLLKRKNEEEMAEQWLTCTRCGTGVHKVCALHNDFVASEEDYVCPTCVTNESSVPRDSVSSASSSSSDGDLYSFVSGFDDPVCMTEVDCKRDSTLTAESLPHTPTSEFIEAKVRERLAATSISNADKTVTVRVISECDKTFNVPEVVRKHFRMPSCPDASSNGDEGVVPPSAVRYSSRAVALFQKIDGLDVCIFCMYVHEYDCMSDDFGGDTAAPQKKRVYIAYLDSVEHFRPRSSRTAVYHEMIVSFLATARARGYESAHIWACPPSRGNSFVFWNHPASQRTPTQERLVSWYHGALSRAVKCGVVTDVQSLFETSFPFEVKTHVNACEVNLDEMRISKDGLLNGRMVCPPLLDGDFWVEEAVRIHGANIARYLKTKPTTKDILASRLDRCPATQMAGLIRDRLIAHASSEPFRRPVNAAAMGLRDYHRIITKPMDLGTVYSRCLLGEFETLEQVVEDVELVFANATRYNPKGHYVHSQALQVRDMFFNELETLVGDWSQSVDAPITTPAWKAYARLSMSLDKTLKSNSEEVTKDPVVSSPDPIVPPPIVPLSSSVVPLAPPAPPLSIAIKNDAHNDALVKPANFLASANLPNSGRKPTRVCSPRGMKRTSKAVYELLQKDSDLLTGGVDAIQQRMVGKDLWMMDKRNPNLPKHNTGKKKGNGKRKKGNEASEEPPTKRRRQSWLGEELGASVRMMRTAFFNCSLMPKQTMTDQEKQKLEEFNEYVAQYRRARLERRERKKAIRSRIADARQALLEFSQFRCLEFDTLRRAKYSTAMILYHLHYDDAPGLIPHCTSCDVVLQEVRWHRIRRVEERHHSGRVPPTLRGGRTAMAPEDAEACHKGEELCASCYDEHPKKDDFIPLQVSIKAHNKTKNRKKKKQQH